MIILAGITLPEQLEWVDRYHWSPVQQHIEQSLAGTMIAFQRPALIRPITLVSRNDIAWIEQQVADDLQQLMLTPAPYVFTLGDDQYSVHFAPDDPIALIPIAANWDLYEGTIKLIAEITP